MTDIVLSVFAILGLIIASGTADMDDAAMGFGIGMGLTAGMTVLCRFLAVHLTWS